MIPQVDDSSAAVVALISPQMQQENALTQFGSGLMPSERRRVL